MIPRAVYWAQALDAAACLGSHGLERAGIVLQCGSGMAALAGLLLPEGRQLELEEVPHLATGSVAGQGRQAVYGAIGGVSCLVLSGRVHLYEGLGSLATAFPAALAKVLGARLLVLLNATGGLNAHYRPGDLMLHTGFINFQHDNPLLHLALDDSSERFVDPKPAYSPQYSAALGAQLAQLGCALHHGIYVGVRGPAYETEAELGMLRGFGADAVGMSLIQELLLSHWLKLPAVGLSVIANECYGSAPLTHAAVLAAVKGVVPSLAVALRAFICSTPGLGAAEEEGYA